jgi:hypothetical protein
VGFEPTCRLPDNTLSRRARYDHFGTSPVRRNSLKRTLDYTADDCTRGSTALPIRVRRDIPSTSGRSRRAPPLLEKRLHQLAARRFAHAADDFEPMIEAGQLGAAHRRDQRPRLRLRRAVDQRGDPRVHRRADAHQTRLDRDAQHGARQPVVPHLPRRVADRHNLGVRGRIAGRDRLVEAAPDNRALQDHDRADRHLAGVACPARLLDRQRHPLVVHQAA